MNSDSFAPLAAVDVAGTADVLAAQMEPYLHKRYGNSAIYAYTNKRAVPPGDVLLAAALAAGLSLDDELGIGREPTEMERQMAELRVEMAGLRDTVDSLQARLDGQPEDPAEEPADLEVMRSRRAAARLAWARRSTAAQPPATQPPQRRAGRGRGT
jgi:hypothetical protein